MRQFSLLDQIDALSAAPALPEPFNRDQATRGIEDWCLRAKDAGLTGLADAARHPVGKNLLAALFGNSPFLGNCLLRDLAFCDALLSQPVETTLAGVLDGLTYPGPSPSSISEIMRLLRRRKHQIALLTAVADISGLWSLEQVTGALSDFAQRSLQLTVSRLLADQVTAGHIALPPNTETDDPAAGSGFTVLGMGKLGARELNYSSDIDLIVLYDDEIMHHAGDRSVGECMVRVTRDLVRTMQERTADGYVFRTDLRLRPDPGATPVALSMAAAETYYESVGLNWERAAMIKARPVAGDLDAGTDFLGRISPFIWRKHLDYAAVKDIHAIKHRIHSHHGHGPITVAGHDVKLGRGGIREIEFTVQAQQLLTGGRDPRLRDRRTCEMLHRLAETGHLDARGATELTDAYRFLRTLEHRLQMVNDEQTHHLPETAEGIAHIACFMGYGGAEPFSAALLQHLERVQAHYENLFIDDLPRDEGGLAHVATAAEGSKAIMDSLVALGFSQPERARKTVHAWGLAPYRAMRYERARTLLNDLIPTILTALSKTAEPDAALARFDDFLRRLPEGVQLFSLLHANAWLLDLLAEIMGSAPRLAALLGHNAGLLDAVLDTDFYQPLADAGALAEDLAQTLERARDYQDVLDLSRSWTNEQRFRVGVQVLRHTISPAQAGRSLSDLADVAIRALLPRAEAEFALRHGRLAGAEMIVLALGKLGGRELTFTSDLDLVFLYQPGNAEASDGDKPLPSGTYFARLSQRLINALTALTGEGRLYEVDMRLRPSGRAGPIAQSIDGFAKYQREAAWTWEHMALTRARIVAATPNSAARIDRLLRATLSAPRDPEKLAADAAEMREKLRAEFGTDDIWRTKHVRGGLLDLEFIVQFLQLKHGHDDPGVLQHNTGEALDALAAKRFLDQEDADLLHAGFTLLTAVQSLLRLCTEDSFDAASAPLGLRDALSAAAGEADFSALEQRLRDTEAGIYRCYQNLFEPPGASGRRNPVRNPKGPETDG